MPEVKATNTASEPTVNAEKELHLVRQQTKIKAGEALIQEFSQVISEQKKKEHSSDKEKEQDSPKDTAEISRTRRWSRINGTASVDKVTKWYLEMEEEDWELFLAWQPDSAMELSEQLQELSKLYLTLLEAALKYAEGEILMEQMERLDSLLVQKLNLLIDQELNQLMSLLEQTGQTTASDSIRASLYRQTSGQNISPRTAHILFSQGRTASSSFTKEGMIYQSSGKQNIRFQQTYHTQQNSWKEQLGQRKEIISNARNGAMENTFKSGSSFSCTGKELVMANRFSSHINNGGNLFKNPDISARNEEVMGLLAAIMSIKGQIYAGETGRTSSFTLPLQNAIEKIIDQYLRWKGASKVYYHTLAAYKQMKNPQKAIEEGENYAYRQFQEKQRNPANQKSTPYSRESGFFRALLKSLNPEKEFTLGIAILQKDWQNFLYAIGNGQSSSHLSEMKIHSPWRAIISAGTHQTGSDGMIGKILLGAALIIIMGTLAVICFQFI